MRGNYKTKARPNLKPDAAGRGRDKDVGKGGVSLKIFAPAIAFTVIMFGTLAWFGWYSYQHLRIVEAQHFRTVQLIGIITHLDEVLTMSARMGVATGDSQWQRRYGEFEPQLDAAIKELTSLAPEAIMGKAVVQTDSANVMLVGMERKAFELVRVGDLREAISILDSGEYAEQKRIYSDGMKDFAEALQAHTDAEIRRHRRQILIVAAFVAVSASLVLFIWFGMLQKLKHGSERRSSKKALRRAEAQFKDFFANTAVGFYRTRPDGCILAANPALVRMLGYSSFEELTQRNLEMEGYEPQYSRSEFKERIEKEGQVVGLESAWARRDGTTLFIIENSRAIRDEHGNTLYYEGTAEDITHRREAHEALKESEANLAMAQRIAHIGSWQRDFKTGKLTWSDETYRLFGLKPNEVEPTFEMLLSYVHPEDRELLKGLAHRAESEGKTVCADFRIIRADGVEREVETQVEIIEVENGKLVGTVGTLQDITERKRVEASLRQSEKWFSSLVSNIPGAVYRCANDADWTMEFLSETNKEITGYPAGDFIKNRVRSYTSIIHPDDRDMVTRCVQEGVSKKQPYIIEYRLVCADGSIRWVYEKGRGVFSRDGEFLWLDGAIFDVSERKKAEEESKKFKTIAERAGYGNAISDLDGNLIHINESFAKMHGYRIDELQGKDLSIFHSEEQMERVNGLNERFLREGSFVGEEVWHKRKDDTTFPTLMNGTLIRDENGSPLFMAATAIDITDRKRAEAAMRQSEQRYKTLVENLPQRVFLKDRNSIYVSCNENLGQDLGISAEEVSGKSDYDLFPVEIAEKYRADDKRVMESGEIKDIDETYVLGGQEIIIHTVKTPVRNEEGNVTGVLGIFWDITEEKRLERALTESEEKYRTLVESAGETIVTMDRDGVYLFINKTGAERLGGKPEDYIGKTIWDAFPKEIADRQMGNIRGVIDTGKGKDFIALSQLQGQMRWYNITIEPLRGGGGEVIAVLIIARDIHEMRQAEMELEAYSEKMTRAERLASLGTLSATLSHELTQPLTVIALSIEDALVELEGISCPNVVTEGLRDSLSEVSNVTTIVERFRNFARKSSGMAVDEVEFRVVAEKIVNLLSKSARQAAVTLHLKDVDKLPMVYFDEKELEQLFFALIQNAIHAADGKNPHNLTIEGAVINKYIELRFSDDCGGIEEADVDNVFEPFFTTKALGEGTGLGLCIVQRVAERAGGEVSVENRPGEGVTFAVKLGISENRMS